MVDFDPSVQGAEYRRDPKIVGQLNLVGEGVPAAVAATKGESGILIATHTRKQVEQVAGYTHAKGAYAYPGLGWSVLVRFVDSEINSEINSVANEVATYMEIAIVVSIILIAFFAFLIGRGIAGSIAGMTIAMRELAGGNKSIDVPSLDRKDEIGGMAAAVALDKMTAQKDIERKAAEDKAKTVAAVTAKFQQNIGQLVTSVSAASTQLQSTAQGLTNNAEQTNHNTSAVASASEEVAANV